MKNKRITIKDIAKELKISASTVSRALNNHPSLKQETITSVKKLARKLNYQPNLLALNLLQKRSNTIAIIVPEITSHFFSTAITAIQDVLVSTDYNSVICLSNESFKEEKEIVNKLSRIHIDGVLVSPSSKTKNYSHFENLQNLGIPVVIFDRDCKGLEADKVLVDDYYGAYKAVEYLIKSGCKNVAHIGGPKNLSTTLHRLNGYLDALKDNGIPVCDDYIVHASGYNILDGIKPSNKLLQLKNRPDAIFAINDSIAIAAMRTAEKLNYSIPDDISIIGFDDEPHAAHFAPSLSTIFQPVYSMGMLSARILLSHLTDDDKASSGFRYEVFQPELVLRDSSRKI
ncbi:LacI family DNA-binding transcriptional regulator [Flagellimonas marinaquae]|uniref:LacI family DNA-binding transcriptional regulator n=1 Tax=Flagellimonas TaxID=444459 RepID=UPI002076254A|nr:LacI family DNA-binding transcriptional regulator [Allomuricauda aquimarina]USD25928.1 LacI family transcriptional regulator [Allomuricauda aquimarina]